MLSTKTNSSCFSKRVKSPYVLQYLAFEERVNAVPQKNRHPLVPHSSQSIINRHNENSLQTLEQVKEIIKKRNAIWTEDKENWVGVEDDHMVTLKEKVERIRNRQKNTEEVTPQDFQLLSRQRTTAPSTSSASTRSRAVSQNSLRPKPNKKGLVNFLQYKKSRRELSVRFRR
jgi:hypothetical protein